VCSPSLIFSFDSVLFWFFGPTHYFFHDSFLPVYRLVSVPESGFKPIFIVDPPSLLPRTSGSLSFLGLSLKISVGTRSRDPELSLNYFPCVDVPFFAPIFFPSLFLCCGGLRMISPSAYFFLPVCFSIFHISRSEWFRIIRVISATSLGVLFPPRPASSLFFYLFLLFKTLDISCFPPDLAPPPNYLFYVPRILVGGRPLLGLRLFTSLPLTLLLPDTFR